MNQGIVQENVLATQLIALAKTETVYFPVKKGVRNYCFAQVTEATTIGFATYRPTIVPPGKKLAPAEDVLLVYESKENGEVDYRESLDQTPRIIAGIRPCDLRAIHLMDQVHSEPPADRHYLTRRAQTMLLVYRCPTPCDETCFCDTVGSLDCLAGADIVLTPGEAEILVQGVSAKGEELLARLGVTPCTEEQATQHIQAYLAARPIPFGRQLQETPKGVGIAAVAEQREAYWSEENRGCFSCGTCTLVCPTCYCFDIRDETGLEGRQGQRLRSWDSCMLPHFSVVAGGHNFRAEAENRQQHRLKRKFTYLPTRFGQDSFCVGCGRCGRQCTAGIDIFTLANNLFTKR